jgi:hypothetical protein
MRSDIRDAAVMFDRVKCSTPCGVRSRLNDASREWGDVMNYTGTRYTADQAAAIMMEARETSPREVRKTQEYARAVAARRQRGGVPIITKTIEHARVPTPAPAPAPVPAPLPVAGDLGALRDYVDNMLVGVVARLQQQFETALDQRDREIRALSNRLEVEIGLSRRALSNRLEVEIGLSRKVARLKSDVAEARAQVR